MDISELANQSTAFEESLEQTKHVIDPGEFGWYPYGTLSNFHHLDKLLTGKNRDLAALIGPLPSQISAPPMVIRLSFSNPSVLTRMSWITHRQTSMAARAFAA